MKRLKVLTVVGTRPEIIRLASVLKALDRYEAIDHVLVHTGQNYDYELNEVFFEDMGLRRPDIFLNAAGSTATTTIGNIINAIDPVIREQNPDAFLVLGDTNSCLCAISAKKYKVPIFHMEAGNRCFDQRVPEETNRKIVDHISDINLTYSDIAREYLLREGLTPDRVIKTGSPMYEVIHDNLSKIERSNILNKLGLSKGGYFIVSTHRAENVDGDKSFERIVNILNATADKYRMPVIVSTHPRTMNRVKETGAEFHELVQLMKPMGFSDYVRLQRDAKAVLSDSGTISEESSILGFSALNLREAHERPEAMEEASVMMTGLSVDRVLNGLSILESQNNSDTPTLRRVSDYSMPNVSEKVVRIILSYTDYVNRVVWSKEI